jgi:RNA polymerase subunit RPABC4/transcription elongation factor Spt4
VSHEYEGGPYITYKGGAMFVRVCVKCSRFVRADKTVMAGEAGLKDAPNATCRKCGRTKMNFVGFIG